MNNYQTWLETPNVVRTIIVQVDCLYNGTYVTKYLSTHPITVDGVVYEPVIKNTITLDESISTSYTGSIGYGDIEIANNDGAYDSWLGSSYVWANKYISVFVGPLPPSGTATLTDFEFIIFGLVDDIDSKSRASINLKLRNKLEKLNTSVSENLLGNYYQGAIVAEATYVNQYRNSIKPLVFGEVHNITPLLTDPTMLEYMVSPEAVEQIVEVRDNGVPVAFTQTSGTIAIPAGSFRLLANPVGTITCSVQGIKKTIDIAGSTTTSTYTNSAGNTIATILKYWGQTLDYSELDTSILTKGTDYTGVYVTDRQNVLALCQEIAKSSGLILTTSRLGKVKLVSLEPPSAYINWSLVSSDVALVGTGHTTDVGLFPILSTMPPGKSYYYGDINNSGGTRYGCTSADALVFLKIAAGDAATLANAAIMDWAYNVLQPAILANPTAYAAYIYVLPKNMITDSDIFINTLTLSQKVDVMAGVKLGYAKNWTVQANLLTGIPQQHKDMYATEWLESSQTDPTVKTSFSVTTEPELETSYLIDKTQADAVALKKLNLFKQQRKIYTMTCTAKMLSLQVGDSVSLTSDRFGLSAGAFGTVISTKADWIRGRIDIGVLI